MKTRSTESRCVIGQENILFVGESVHLSAPEILQAGAVKGLSAMFTFGGSHYERDCPLLQASTAGCPDSCLCDCFAQPLKEQVEKHTSCFAMAGSVSQSVSK